jgi:hypothetical protein
LRRAVRNAGRFASVKRANNIFPDWWRLFLRTLVLTLTAIVAVEGRAAEPAELYFADPSKPGKIRSNIVEMSPAGIRDLPGTIGDSKRLKR